MNTFTKDSPALRQPLLIGLGLLGAVLLAGIMYRPETAPALPQLKKGGVTVAAAAAPVPAPPAIAAIPAPNLEIPAEVVPVTTGGGPAAGATPAPAEAVASSGLSGTDRAFLEMAAKVADQENEISGKVLSHLIYPEVREYACAIIDGHEAVSAELSALAARKGVVLPAPGKISQRVRGRDDGTLDRRYVSLMAEGNKEVVEMFKQAAQSEDPDIAAFARKMLPTIENRLTTAQNLEKLRE